MSSFARIHHIWLKLAAKCVGRDASGNLYYQRKSRRHVVYAGHAEATKVPAPWFLWLHHMSDAIPQGEVHAVTPNRTGTPWAYRPRYANAWAARRDAGVDYQAWRP